MQSQNEFCSLDLFIKNECGFIVAKFCREMLDECLLRRTLFESLDEILQCCCKGFPGVLFIILYTVVVTFVSIVTTEMNQLSSTFPLFCSLLYETVDEKPVWLFN